MNKTRPTWFATRSYVTYYSIVQYFLSSSQFNNFFFHNVNCGFQCIVPFWKNRFFKLTGKNVKY